MPQQTDSAKRTRLCHISTELTGRKLRIAGRLLTYDVESGLAVVLDGFYGILVDITLVLDSRSKWAQERMTTIMAIGDLEETDEPLRCQIRPSHYSAAFTISERLILRAILVVSAPDLDIGLWNAILVEEEEEEKIRIR